MKKFGLFLLPTAVLGLCLAFCGCTTVQSTSGRDFDSAKIGQVIKGKTTTEEILQMFGKPNNKQPELDDAELWSYSYVTATNKVGNLWVPHSEITGYKKNLKILFNKDKVVANYTMDEGPLDKETVTVHQF